MIFNVVLHDLNGHLIAVVKNIKMSLNPKHVKVVMGSVFLDDRDA